MPPAQIYPLRIMFDKVRDGTEADPIFRNIDAAALARIQNRSKATEIKTAAPW
jgi:hypothetical protein